MRVTAAECKEKNKQNRKKKKTSEQIGKKKEQKKKEKYETIEPVAARCCSATAFGATIQPCYSGKS